MPKSKIERIVKDAEFTPVAPEETEKQVGFNTNDVAEMVMVGRYKTGKEFIIPVNTEDVLKAKQYCEMGAQYFNLLLERHLIGMIREKESK